MDEESSVDNQPSSFETTPQGIGLDNAWVIAIPNRFKGRNKDRYEVAETSLIVADGVSGASNDYRSDITADTMTKGMKAALLNYHQMVETSSELYSPERINEDLFTICSQASGQIRGVPESTLAFATQLPTTEGNQLFIANMGDSPVYLVEKDPDRNEWYIKLETIPDTETRTLPPRIRRFINYCLRNIAYDPDSEEYQEALRNYQGLITEYQTERIDPEAHADPAVLASIDLVPVDSDSEEDPLKYYYERKNIISGVSVGFWTRDHVKNIPITNDTIAYIVSSDFVGLLNDEEIGQAVQNAHASFSRLPLEQQNKQNCARIISQSITENVYGKVDYLADQGIIADDDFTLLTQATIPEPERPLKTESIPGLLQQLLNRLGRKSE